MAPAVLHRVLHGTTTPSPSQHSRLTISPALLPGFNRHKVRNADYPCIIPFAVERAHLGADSLAFVEREVRGTVVRGLTARDVELLDIFEGEEYERRMVSVRLLGGEDAGVVEELVGVDEGQGEEGEVVEAETYVFVAGVEQLDLGEWDFDAFVREKMRRWLGEALEEGIADVDEHLRAEDPTRGRMTNGAITKALEESRGKREGVDGSTGVRSLHDSTSYAIQ
ncbi:hypothetical protein P152DRAFT_449612 [Eremomyces bilateralis CBS 781.70]|uniref:Putative gamma-glutamylcyclotransferase n=1 Tax=Eremomyces bilateralis CBS 781.70 TaxID=1392243 RepID=A0A6G1G345_9PEZI|nr:uncharacterized protein P152DRAFT_449612 [Eremomyces bilateralis CBS 781.70]KAF1812351.1 hypothetical protein P152DRAFT_449612 [Eremomyces bilateralis CBS 781.70]